MTNKQNYNVMDIKYELDQIASFEEKYLDEIYANYHDEIALNQFLYDDHLNITSFNNYFSSNILNY